MAFALEGLSDSAHRLSPFVRRLKSPGVASWHNRGRCDRRHSGPCIFPHALHARSQGFQLRSTHSRRSAKITDWHRRFTALSGTRNQRSSRHCRDVSVGWSVRSMIMCLRPTWFPLRCRRMVPNFSSSTVTVFLPAGRSGAFRFSEDRLAALEILQAKTPPGLATESCSLTQMRAAYLLRMAMGRSLASYSPRRARFLT